MNTAQRLSAFAKIINQFGPYSTEAEEFLESHKKDSAFCRQAMISRALKVVFVPESALQNNQSLKALIALLRSGVPPDEIEAFLAAHQHEPQFNRLKEIATVGMAVAQMGFLNRVPCPAPEENASFVLNMLEPKRKKEVQLHILGCVQCCMEVDALRTAIQEVCAEEDGEISDTGAI